MIIKKNGSINMGLKITNSYGDLMATSDLRKVWLKDRRAKLFEKLNSKKYHESPGSLIQINRIGTRTSTSIENSSKKKSRLLFQKFNVHNEVRNPDTIEMVWPHKRISLKQNFHYSRNLKMHDTSKSSFSTNQLFLRGFNINSRYSDISQTIDHERNKNLSKFFYLNGNDVDNYNNNSSSLKINKFISDFVNFANEKRRANHIISRIEQKSFLSENFNFNDKDKFNLTKQIVNLKSSEFLRTLNNLTFNDKRKALSRSKIDFSKTLVCKNIKLFDNLNKHKEKLHSINKLEAGKMKEKILKTIEFKIPAQIMLYKS